MGVLGVAVATLPARVVVTRLPARVVVARLVHKPRLIEVYSPLHCTVVIRAAKASSQFRRRGGHGSAGGDRRQSTCQGGRRQASNEGGRRQASA